VTNHTGTNNVDLRLKRSAKQQLFPFLKTQLLAKDDLFYFQPKW